MYKGFLVLALLIFQINNAFTQISKDAKFQYYVEVENVESKTNAKQVSTNVQKHSEVVYFLAVRVPKRFYIIETKTAITQTRLQNWIGSNLSIKKFEASKYTIADIKKLKGFKN
jgi:hypothetical protein